MIILVCFPATFVMNEFTQSRRPHLPASYEGEDLTLQGKRLKGWALGYEGLIADWYWMRSLQYIGDKVLRSEAEYINLEDLRPLDPRLLYPMLDNATDLDPKFIAAFSYGASVLPAIDAEQAIRLTEKGIEHNPDSWRLYQYLGYIHWRLGDFERAAQAYERGAAIEGAPAFMREMVAAMRTHGGSRETAREIYRLMAADAGDQQSRANAELRLMELDSLDERDALEAALQSRRSATGRCPASFVEILPMLRETNVGSARGLRVNENGALADPLGFPYQIESSTCRAVLHPRSKIPKPMH